MDTNTRTELLRIFDYMLFGIAQPEGVNHDSYTSLVLLTALLFGENGRKFLTNHVVALGKSGAPWHIPPQLKTKIFKELTTTFLLDNISTT